MEYEYEVYCYCTLTGIITKIGDICVPIYKKCTEASDKVHLFLAICKMCLLFLFVIKSFFEIFFSMTDFLENAYSILRIKCCMMPCGCVSVMCPGPHQSRSMDLCKLETNKVV